MEFVPAAILEPPEARARGFDRCDATLVLDGYLRRLASQDHRCRAILGRLARLFLKRAGYHQLGFARLGDYARERLGLSGRELQSLAAVSVGLKRLPATRVAFEQGTLSWAQVRLLVGVATPGTEDEWLARAAGRTVRALAALIREWGRPASEDEEEEEEPRVRFRLRCPQRVLGAWRAVVELAQRMAGSELTQGQAAETIAAEGLSARPACGESWPAPLVVAGERLDSETRQTFADIDWAAVAEALPEDVERLMDGADELDPFALDERMRTVLRTMQRIDWQTGRLLRVFLDRRLYRLMWFPSAARYLTERLGISARKARALVMLERRTWEAPALGEAYRAGRLSWVRALTILPVAAEGTADAWVTRAEQVPIRRLADEVEWALTVRDGLAPIAPPPAGAPLDVPWQMCARRGWEWADAEIVFSAPVSVVSLFRAAVLAFAHPSGPPWDGLERLLLHVKTEWEGQPRHRDPIFARDRWRCAVPVCTARRNLHDHHLVFRSHGGDNARENRITLCAWHHLRGIHAGRIRAFGEAPHAVTWEIGVRAGRKPLLRLEGDRYA